MSNILAIAHKELKSYFSSPIAYIAIGLWALLYGYFFFAILNFFVRQSMQMNQFGPQALNLNQQLIRPLLQNVTILILFLMPMVTMRTYSEEKRSGTIELLLTSPITDFQIVLGKFFGALSLYAVMLLVTLLHLGALYFYGGRPEWKPIITSYIGLLLLGGCFVAIGLFVSSLTKNQMVAGVGTFVVLLLLWIINWMADSAGPWLGEIMRYLSITEHFDDFGKGVIDTKHLVFYLSVIVFGLFLTLKSVDSERWRG